MSEAQQLAALQLLLMLLPAPNRACLQLLLAFLARVAARHAVNKMGLANLVRVR